MFARLEIRTNERPDLSAARHQRLGNAAAKIAGSPGDGDHGPGAHDPALLYAPFIEMIDGAGV